jgi:ABC-type lipoprotein export system ATPase subunit
LPASSFLTEALYKLMEWRPIGFPRLIAEISGSPGWDSSFKSSNELLDYLSVLDNIVLPYRINSSLVLKGQVWSRAKGLAEEVGIGHKLNRHPRELSQGERQRVAVCRALVTEPAIILADEPTGNLDPTNKGKVLSILLEYAEQKGATLVTVTHDHDLLKYFQRIIDFKEFYGTAQKEARDTAPKEVMVLD